MKNYKVINSHNLLHNLSQFNSKKVCAMVKANAYGHGVQEVVSILNDKVDCFGVANEREGAIVRRYTQKPIIVVGRVQDYGLCKRNQLEIMVESITDLRLAQKFGLEKSCHLKINCGMNRFGESSFEKLNEIDEFLRDNHIILKSVFTHFSNTQKRSKTEEQYSRFFELRTAITQNPPICFGGSGIIKYPYGFQIVRVGIALYGYEEKNLLPVMKIVSYVSKIFAAKRGEYIGYGEKYRVKNDGVYAVVPVGYADGLKRCLAGKFCVEINGKRYKSVGNICMDVFFVQIDESVKTNDEVVILSDVVDFAKKCKTISYEILTGFSSFRGKTKIE